MSAIEMPHCFLFCKHISKATAELFFLLIAKHCHPPRLKLLFSLFSSFQGAIGSHLDKKETEEMSPFEKPQLYLGFLSANRMANVTSKAFE